MHSALVSWLFSCWENVPNKKFLPQKSCLNFVLYLQESSFISVGFLLREEC